MTTQEGKAAPRKDDKIAPAQGRLARARTAQASRKNRFVWQPDDIQIEENKGASAKGKPKTTPSRGPALSRITPGEYRVKGNRSIGKAHLVVRADGTGIYTNSRGERVELSARRVRSQYAAGMNHRLGDS